MCALFWPSIRSTWVASGLITFGLITMVTCLSAACNDDGDTSSAQTPDTEGAADAPDVTQTTDTETSEPAPICGLMDGLCDGPTVTTPTVGTPIILAPNTDLPGEVVSQLSHNNLDATFWQGRFWLAFRTAPSHFASPDTVLYVVSTDRLGPAGSNVSWRFEGSFNLQTDLREPQLVPFGDELRFYFAVLGTDPQDFEPQGVRMTTWRGPGQWDPLETVFEDGFIPWRIKPFAAGDGATSMSVFGYTGGENIYDVDGDPIRVHWLTSDDGVTWSPALDGQPVVLEGGSSETDAVRLDDGTLIAVSRNEAGDETGFGMKVCRANADALGDWSCQYDKKKYDSPLLFRNGETIYLVGRRNVTDSGHYDLNQEHPSRADRAYAYQADYWTHPKRCALWTVDPETLTVDFVLDLPSAGDTCFPEYIRVNDHRVIIVNYSSPWEAANDPETDPSWLSGQLAETLIYAVTLDLP